MIENRIDESPPSANILVSEDLGNGRTTKVRVDEKHASLTTAGDRTGKVDRGERLPVARHRRGHGDDATSFRRTGPLDCVPEHPILIGLERLRLQQRDET